MISNKKTKFIKSLQLKKFRKSEGAFIVEGAKIFKELLMSPFQIQAAYVTQSFYDSLPNNIRARLMQCPFEVVDEQELVKVGTLRSNNAALAIVGIKGEQAIPYEQLQRVLLLDQINDPGNLGTIIRIADWYAIRHIVCSPATADLYNPKTINASMGSFTRVNVYHHDLAEFISRSGLPVYGTLLKGVDVHAAKFPARCSLLIGNESHGISDDLIDLVDFPITIPKFGGAESLNAAIATAIVCDIAKNQD